jgi:hypothetical protein
MEKRNFEMKLLAVALLLIIGFIARVVWPNAEFLGVSNGPPRNSQPSDSFWGSALP